MATRTLHAQCPTCVFRSVLLFLSKCFDCATPRLQCKCRVCKFCLRVRKNTMQKIDMEDVRRQECGVALKLEDVNRFGSDVWCRSRRAFANGRLCRHSPKVSKWPAKLLGARSCQWPGMHHCGCRLGGRVSVPVLTQRRSALPATAAAASTPIFSSELYELYILSATRGLVLSLD
ncbi:hypothetical protein FA95DRAFT_618147 [Auriscalpium vulgare]|uniref:Uncharacterized protein n=1 Tax=Auriscalpium vulgare TaxID=40419 RepID=A0ACB8REJ2_9AGAM|nr:hypothetical protein FA95DRAFT_618147 [Auriscalpium vulgare]